MYCILTASKKEEDPKLKKVQSVLEGSVAWTVGHGDPSSSIMDSGAFLHMTGNKGFYKDLKPTTGLSVMLGDGEKAEVAGIGGVSLVAINGYG